MKFKSIFLAAFAALAVFASCNKEDDRLGSNAKPISIAEFLENADENTPYRLTGMVVNYSSKYVSFDLIDVEDNSKIYVFSINDKSQHKAELSNGCIVTLEGKYKWFEHSSDPEKSKAEIENAKIVHIDQPNIQKPTDADLQVVDFDQYVAAEPSFTKWYKLTAEIYSIDNPEYGTMTLCSGDNTFEVYGTTKDFALKNDKSFSKIDGLTVGDIVTIGTLRGERYGNPQAGSTFPAYYISHEDKPLPKRVMWTLDSNSYNDKVEINGSESKALKIGKSKGTGTATVTFPEGTTKLKFAAVGWSNKHVVLSCGEGESATEVVIKGHPGATETGPYKLSNIDDTYYVEIPVTGTSIKVSTVKKEGEAYKDYEIRAVLFDFSVIE